MEVPYPSFSINQVLGSTKASSDVLTGVNISLPYQEIRHTLCGVQYTAKWIRHGHRRYHQSYPYAYINWEARVWFKIVMNYFIPGLHFTKVMRDQVCLVYALMKHLPIVVGVKLESAM